MPHSLAFLAFWVADWPLRFFCIWTSRTIRFFYRGLALSTTRDSSGLGSPLAGADSHLRSVGVPTTSLHCQVTHRASSLCGYTVVSRVNDLLDSIYACKLLYLTPMSTEMADVPGRRARLSMYSSIGKRAWLSWPQAKQLQRLQALAPAG